MKYFIGASLYNNAKMSTIDILDPNADAICERIKHDNKYSDHFTAMLQPHKVKWEKSDFTIAS